LKSKIKFLEFLKENNLNQIVRINFVLPEGVGAQSNIIFKKRILKSKKYTIEKKNNKNIYEIYTPEFKWEEISINVTKKNIEELGFDKNLIKYCKN
jgi:hypothetical protein